MFHNKDSTLFIRDFRKYTNKVILIISGAEFSLPDDYNLRHYPTRNFSPLNFYSPVLLCHSKPTLLSSICVILQTSFSNSVVKKIKKKFLYKPLQKIVFFFLFFFCSVGHENCLMTQFSTHINFPYRNLDKNSH